MSRFAAKHASALDDSLTDVSYEMGFSYPTSGYSYITKAGLNEGVVREISHIKLEPAWMLEKRLEALKIFESKPTPTWGGDLLSINYDKIHYYLRPTDKQVENWDDVPTDVKKTFEKLKIPEAERAVLAGVKAQYDSEVVYGSLKNVWEKEGVIFLSMDEGLAQYPELIKEYFGKLIPAADNKFSALNTAVWSGGSFVYVPKGVNVKLPLQAYFRINAANAGQFERTLIIVDEGASVHYIEGCTAPAFSSSSLHSAVVEIYVKKGARCQYTTVQNWYKNVYNLVTKRARVDEEGTMIWTDFNMGSKLTMKYPSFLLAGKGAKGETLSMAMAGKGQHQDTGSKAIHLAPYTSSTIVSKSISKDGGRTSYRGMVTVDPRAHHSKNTVICDALLLDPLSRSDTYPLDRIMNDQVEIQHEATVSKIGDEQLFYLMSRGITEEMARKMIVNGFVDDLVRKLPLEYAVEMNRLIDHEMEGSIG
ncbi:Fe-S cluster assembly protein SufB [Candidatus Cerribacteria bacterium 'Amazon FNV 2010 28 9']|uniref:Fe-S cluster assembly protein SufB n=1 Tax=Candidatus Cerribacteria bacterium 'Amazon FNV 2010 28 9' TaxID=2081795 RepID=A0A317JNV3_9BACT|nr:MAG: Fe-S cluster assembly protein SufB [Candidatus Cerribacteria bacterium 'Amazon FNV 2010 28 9']